MQWRALLTGLETQLQSDPIEELNPSRSPLPLNVHFSQVPMDSRVEMMQSWDINLFMATIDSLAVCQGSFMLSFLPKLSGFIFNNVNVAF